MSRGLRGGDVYTQRLTFPEGLTIAEMAEVYESRGFGSAREFIKAASDAALVKDLDPKAGDLEGLSVSGNLSAAAPRQRVAGRGDDGRSVSVVPMTTCCGHAPRRQRMTTRQVVTLASLIEKETAQGR